MGGKFMILYLMRGTTCSGKDTYCEKYFYQHNVLSSDKFRGMLTGSISDQSRNALVFDTLRQILELRLQNGCLYTVVNATNLKFRDCKEYLALADKYNVEVVCISIQPPSIEEMIKRNENRAKTQPINIPEEVIRRHYDTYMNSTDAFVDAFISTANKRFIELSQSYEEVRTARSKEWTL
jgi:predicted kinase